jgi:hypothetical protein
MDRAEAAEAENRRLAARIAALEAGAGTGGAGSGAAAAATPSATPAAAAAPPPNDNGDVLALNVSGVEMWALRSALLSVPGSRLAAMFGGSGGYGSGSGSGSKAAAGGGDSAGQAAAAAVPTTAATPSPPPLSTDARGRPFLPYRPRAFAAVLAALHEVVALGGVVDGLDGPSAAADGDGGGPSEQYVAALVRHLGLEGVLQVGGPARRPPSS